MAGKTELYCEIRLERQGGNQDEGVYMADRGVWCSPTTGAAHAATAPSKLRSNA